MQINMPVPYTAVAVKKGCRNPDEIKLMTYVPMEIREIDSYEAPIAIANLNLVSSRNAFEVNHTRWFEDANWALDAGDIEFNADDFTRALEGRSWEKPSSHRYSHKWRTAFGEGHFATHWLEDLHPDYKHDPYSSRTLKDYTLFEKKNFREIRSHNLEDGIEDMQRLCSELLLIDGKLYSKRDTPLFVCGREHSFAFVDFGTGFAQQLSSAFGKMDVFTLDRIDDFLSHAEKSGCAIDHDKLNPHLFIPDAAYFPDEEYSLMNAIKHIVSDDVSQHLNLMTEEQGINWFRLRSAFTEVFKADTNAAIENAAELLHKMTESLESQIRYKDGHRGNDKIDLASKLGFEAIERWSMRPINFDLGPGL